MSNTVISGNESTGDISGLISSLKNKDQMIRLDAVEALRRIGDTQAIEALIGALNDPYSFDPAAVHRGDRSWEEMGSEEFVYPVRKAAAEALAQILKAKNSTKPNINGLVAKKDVEGLIAALDYLRNDETLYPYRQIDNESIQKVLGSIDAEARWIRCQAAEALQKFGDQRAVEPMLKALDDDDPLIRKAAILSMNKFRERRAVEPLLRILDAKDNDRLSEIAAAALGEIGDERAVEPLIARLRSNNTWSMRSYAAEALGNIGDSRAIDAVTESSWNDENEIVRTRATRALQVIAIHQQHK